LTVSGLVAWYRADLGVTTVTGRVSAWLDQSGTSDANKNLSQGTAGNRPTLVASDVNFNNQSTFSFASADPDFLSPPGAWATSITQPCTIFSVHLVSSLAAQVTYYDDRVINASFGLIQSLGGGFNARAPTNLGGFDNTLNESVAFCSVFNGASGMVFKNQKTANVTGAIGSNGSTGLIVGVAAGLASGHQGTLAEIIVYNSDIGATSRAVIWTYLGARYNISIGA
jgi:hypothetical protein